MKIIKLVVFLSFLVLASNGTNAQDLEDSAAAKKVRVKYVHSPLLPDGIAFASTLRMLNLIHSHDPHSAFTWVWSNTGLDGEEAQELINLMLSTKKELDDQIDNRSREIGCELGVPRAVGEQVFSLLESMDDSRDILGSESLIAFKGKLDTETAARFQQWLDQRKVDITHVKTNHREVFESTGTSPDAMIAGICDALEQRAEGEQK